MEVHKNSCYKCGGTCEGAIQAGWFICRECKTNQPRYMLVRRPTPLAPDSLKAGDLSLPDTVKVDPALPALGG